MLPPPSRSLPHALQLLPDLPGTCLTPLGFPCRVAHSPTPFTSSLTSCAAPAWLLAPPQPPPPP
ncbi:hypothetical protein PCASD_19041 [Puccinia coronata f. sp. avenae]|uniref:Uncharacterized protein n=1 Tax=Puccinia coronata f. sp. avenae TaxID=200324 RepID=A0A2N5TWM5_9BASI|nr:hypothetical protein PCASD_19041 [Puccinia coronata f. sp. avenae]